MRDKITFDWGRAMGRYATPSRQFGVVREYGGSAPGASTLWAITSATIQYQWPRDDQFQNGPAGFSVGDTVLVTGQRQIPHSADRLSCASASSNSFTYANNGPECESYATVTGSAYHSRLSMEDYMGVYELTQYPKRGANQVPIKKLLPTDNSGANLTGGYIIKMDYLDVPADLDQYAVHLSTFQYDRRRVAAIFSR